AGADREDDEGEAAPESAGQAELLDRVLRGEQAGPVRRRDDVLAWFDRQAPSVRGGGFVGRAEGRHRVPLRRRAVIDRRVADEGAEAGAGGAAQQGAGEPVFDRSKVSG